MGFSPRQMDEMEIWQYMMLLEGFEERNSGMPSAPTDEEFYAATGQDPDE